MLGDLTELYKKIVFHQDPIMNSVISVMLLIFLGAIAWWIINSVLKRVEKKYQETPFFKKNDHVFQIIRKAGHYSILLLVGVGIVDFIDIPMLEKIFFAFMILLLASFCNGIVKELLPYIEQKYTINTESKFDDVIFNLFNKFASVIIFLTAIVLALDVIGVNIMPFIAGAGVVGIAIGFAAKDTLSNIIAGILLIIDRPFEVGDRIEVWSAPVNAASWGDVVDVGLRATRIRTTDNIVIIIPNNEIMKRDIINYTAITKEIRVRIPIVIAYDVHVKEAKEVVSSVSLELDWVMKNPAPKVVVKGFGDSAVNLEARVWISDPRKRMDTISCITDRVKEVFTEKGFEIPFPKRDIYIKKEE